MAAKARVELACYGPAGMGEIVQRRKSYAAPGTGDMETAGTVTGFAGLLTVRRVGIVCIAVRGVRHERHLRAAMAHQAGVRSTARVLGLRYVPHALRMRPAHDGADHQRPGKESDGYQ